MSSADMLSIDEAADVTGASRVTIKAWIRSLHCIAVSNRRCGLKLPRWQFEPNVWPALKPLATALGTTDGWQSLVFLETGALALGGQTPRAALEQGVSMQRILAIARAAKH